MLHKDNNQCFLRSTQDTEMHSVGRTKIFLGVEPGGTTYGRATGEPTASTARLSNSRPAEIYNVIFMKFLSSSSFLLQNTF